MIGTNLVAAYSPYIQCELIGQHEIVLYSINSLSKDLPSEELDAIVYCTYPAFVDYLSLPTRTEMGRQLSTK